MGATSDLAHFSTSLSLDQIPESGREAAKAALLDVFACALAGRDERVSSAVREWVASEGAPPVGPTCAIWGTRARTSPSRAALANGAAAHALDYDDVSWAMNGHPSTVIGPATLSAVESRRGTGADLVLGYITGLEVAGRIGEMVGHAHYDRGWHPTATLGALGATAAVAKALGTEQGILETALGIASSMASGSRMNFGTDTKPLHAGLAAESAVVAVELASRGVTARRDGLEAKMGFYDLFGGEGSRTARTVVEPLVILDPGIELKPYPSCRFTHRVIDAVLALRARHPSATAMGIECTVDPFSRQILIYPAPRTGLEAKFSMPYCASIAWLEGTANLHSFADERVRGSDVQGLLSRVHVRDGRADEESVTITFDDGSSDREAIVLPLGHPRRPMTEGQRLEKVRACAEPLLGSPAARDLVETMRGLEDVQDVTKLVRLLALSGRAP